MIEDIQFDTFGSEDHKHFIVELRPTSKCNYNCYYCPDLHINSNPIKSLNLEDLKQLLTTIKQKQKRDIHVFICGGEPTLYAELPELILSMCEYLKETDIVTIQTNLSKPLRWIQEFSGKIEHCNKIVRINGSYHNIQNIDIYSYIIKCLYIKQKRLLGMVSFGYNSRKCVKKDYLTFKNLVGEEHSEIVPLINGSVDQDKNKGNGSDRDIDYIYDHEDMEEFEKYGSFFEYNLKYTDRSKEGKTTHAKMWKTRKNNFLGYKCSVTKHKLYVDWDGSCFGCFNHQFSSAPRLFHIHEHEKIIKYFMEPKCMNCPFTTCFFDLEYKKQKQSTDTKEIKISRKFNTKTFREP